MSRTGCRFSSLTCAHSSRSSSPHSSFVYDDSSGVSAGRRMVGRATLGDPSAHSRTAASAYQDTIGDVQVVCAVAESRGTSATVGLAYVDLTTSRAVLCQIADNQTYTRAIHKIWVWNCSVLLIPSTVVSSQSKLMMFLDASPDVKCRLRSTDRRYFNETEGQTLLEQLAVEAEVGALKVAAEGKYYAVACLCAVIQFLKIDMEITFAPHTLRFSYEPSEGSMMIDLLSIHSLEVVQNLADRRSKDSLLGLLDRTSTLMGSRLLKSNILQPLVDVEVLLKRYEAIAELSANQGMFVLVRTALKGLVDVDKALSQLVIVPSPPKVAEWLQHSINHVLVLKTFFTAAAGVSEALHNSRSPLLGQILALCNREAYGSVSALINEHINEDTMFSRRPAELQAQRAFAIKSGTNGLLDVARQVYKETLDDISDHCQELKEFHKLALTIEFDSKRGRYLRFPASKLQQHDLDHSVFIHVCKNRKWVECQTMELVKLNNKLWCSQAEILNMSASVIQGLIEQIRINIAPLFRMSDGIALLDVLAALTAVASSYDYVKPQIGNTFAVKAARHPILVKILDHRVVPNDCYAEDSSRLQILTGCNMSGKSTYIRTIALLQIMAQIGSFVPAEHASFRIRDQLFTRISTDDNLVANVSTFASEMREAAFILRSATAQSLVIVDELGRGTSTRDGLAVAIAIAEALLESKALVWFVTHFHDLASFFSNVPGVFNLHFRVDIEPGSSQISMLYKIDFGIVPVTSYGILIAQAANLPRDIIEVATAVSAKLDSEFQTIADNSRANIQMQKRQLLVGLQQHLTIAASASNISDSAMHSWLKDLQARFIVQMANLHQTERLAIEVQRRFSRTEPDVPHDPSELESLNLEHGTLFSNKRNMSSEVLYEDQTQAQAHGSGSGISTSSTTTHNKRGQSLRTESSAAACVPHDGDSVVADEESCLVTGHFVMSGALEPDVYFDLYGEASDIPS